MSFNSSLYVKSSYPHKSKFEPKNNFVRPAWIRKFELEAHISFTSLWACMTNFRYFNNGCSKHMIGDYSDLINYKECGWEHVTFADGIKVVLGKGTLNIKGFPRLEIVLHVECLKANFLSISLFFFNQNLMLNFDSNKCQV